MKFATGILIFAIFIASLVTSVMSEETGNETDNEIAQKVVVGFPGSFEQKTISLEPGESADIVVHLLTFGVVVSGYKIALVRDVDGKLLSTIISDKHGLVKFSRVPPGEYTVTMLRTEEQKMEAQIGIGDVIVSLSEETKKERDEAEGRRKKEPSQDTIFKPSLQGAK